ncbi:hypothetical protein AWC38_SpisGene10049 [Stylophora pistillata]|uniref:Uncharacterized protein n=1 Tax=Stylophora pistillata TaxID=50429 RepID=A0A2B4S989_STYPI|nr:hypothetical protein AWC38_SpisGene10049 [Stylophora pistillata]
MDLLTKSKSRTSCLTDHNIPEGTRELEEQLEKQDVRSRVSPAVFRSQSGLECKDRLNQSANDKCDSYAEARGVGKFAESLCRGLIFQHETPHIQLQRKLEMGPMIESRVMDSGTARAQIQKAKAKDSGTWKFGSTRPQEN